MSDEQVHKRMVSKRLLIVSVLLIILGGALLYYRQYRQPDLQQYRSQKQQESSLESQVTTLENTITQLSETIEANGKQLVSFSEDKIVYINLASELSTKWDVNINKLSVSDVWMEGQMFGMTTAVEIEGNFEAVRGFISDYCGVSYTNRITTISCRPNDRYLWMHRDIDDQLVLDWFDIANEFELYSSMTEEALRELNQERIEQGLEPIVLVDGNNTDRAISLEQMFADFTFKLYLEVDFLGRQ